MEISKKSGSVLVSFLLGERERERKKRVDKNFFCSKKSRNIIGDENEVVWSFWWDGQLRDKGKADRN